MNILIPAVGVIAAVLFVVIRGTQLSKLSGNNSKTLDEINNKANKLNSMFNVIVGIVLIIFLLYFIYTK